VAYLLLLWLLWLLANGRLVEYLGLAWRAFGTTSDAQQ